MELENINWNLEDARFEKNWIVDNNVIKLKAERYQELYKRSNHYPSVNILLYMPQKVVKFFINKNFFLMTDVRQGHYKINDFIKDLCRLLNALECGQDYRNIKSPFKEIKKFKEGLPDNLNSISSEEFERRLGLGNE